MHELHVASRRKQPSTLEKQYPGAVFLDVTSRGPEPWVRFSPFYPHGGIPVPMSPGTTATSVEGIWQALKVFEGSGVDASKLTVSSMRGIKRTVRKHGRVLGHQAGLAASSLLDYKTARFEIYLPSYRWVLEHCLQKELSVLRQLLKPSAVVLLDYETNSEVEELSRPLSHASLVAAYIRGDWPESTSRRHPTRRCS